mmetsp:Transcript_1109/g.2000  ORF Transcript_1109/g.2000 Transcript_1109/m.2000 type:complete len:494 (+) Transcript_1109:18-1499(+)
MKPRLGLFNLFNNRIGCLTLILCTIIDRQYFSSWAFTVQNGSGSINSRRRPIMMRWRRGTTFDRSSITCGGHSSNNKRNLSMVRMNSSLFFSSINPDAALTSSSSSSSISTATTSNDDVHDSEKKNKKQSMKGCVCVVTGASRGIGKGIALELGKAGATVYITGTSSSTSSSMGNNDHDTNNQQNHVKTSSKYVTNEVVGGPETIEQTAEEIDQVGGIGIPIYCDHSQDDQVQKLFDIIQENHERLDLLVNNVFRVPSGGGTNGGLFGKFWEVGIPAWDTIHTVGCRSHYVASCFAIPLMKKNSPRALGSMTRPMIAMISSFGGITYTFNVAYGVGKAAVDRLAKDMAVELTEEDIVVTSFYPGVVLTERTLRAVSSGEWEKNVGIPLDNAETPGYTGKAIISVATDATNMSKTGKVQVVSELAQEYGFTEEDGRQPPSIRSLRFLLPAYGFDDATREKVKVDWIPDWKIPFFVMAQGKPPSKSSSLSSSSDV